MTNIVPTTVPIPHLCRCGCGSQMRTQAFYASLGCVGVHARQLGRDAEELWREAVAEYRDQYPPRR